MKDLEQFKKLKLKDHMEANRPPQMSTVTPRGIFLTYDLVSNTRKDMIGTVNAYRKYLPAKFSEYFTDCLNKMNAVLKELDKNYAV